MIVNCWIEIPINCKFPYYVLILINKKIQLNVSFCCYQIKCVGVGGAWNTANVHSGSTVAIFGLGVVGLAVSFLFFLFPPPLFYHFLLMLILIRLIFLTLYSLHFSFLKQVIMVLDYKIGGHVQKRKND